MGKTKKTFKKIAFLTALVVTGLSLASCMISKPQQLPSEEQVRTITVSGTGSVIIKPDIASLTFAVKTTDWNVNNAENANNEATEKIIAAVRGAGVAKPDINAYDHKISQETYWSNSRELPGRYTVTSNINIKVRTNDLVGKVIDAAAKSGGNTTTLSKFEYFASDATTVIRDARTLAIQRANDAANFLAAASGCKVDKVMYINESYSTSNASVSEIPLGSAKDFEPPIQEGTIAVTSNVTITYSLLE